MAESENAQPERNAQASTEERPRSGGAPRQSSRRQSGGRDRQRGRGGGRPRGRGRRDGRRFMRRRRCYFCEEKIKHIDYKNTGMLRPYLTDRGKIRPRRQTGTCAAHQRMVSAAIKRARHLALLPFVSRGSGGRRGGGRRPR